MLPLTEAGSLIHPVVEYPSTPPHPHITYDTLHAIINKLTFNSTSSVWCCFLRNSITYMEFKFNLQPDNKTTYDIYITYDTLHAMVNKPTFNSTSTVRCCLLRNSITYMR